MHMWRVYVGGDEVIPPWFIALQKVKACGVGGGICWTPFHFSLLQPPQPVLSAPFSPNASSKQWHFSGKPHLNVQSSFTPAMCLSVDLCVCRLPSRAPAGHRKWRASPFPPNQYHRCEWIPVFISFNTLGKRRGYEKSDDGERWRRWQKVVILPLHLSLPKKGCGKWLVAQDARQHEPFPTGLEMIRGRAFCTNTHFSPPHMLFSPPLCTHDLPPPYFIIPQIRQSLIEPRERHLILRSAFFFFPPIAYLRFLKLGILIGKLKYGVRSHSGAVQSKANETLVRQIALKGLGEQRGVFGSIPASC